MLLAVLAGTGGCYVVSHYPVGSEYKLAVLMNLTLALLAAPAFGALALSRPLVAATALTLFFAPVGFVVTAFSSGWHSVSNVWVEEGVQIAPGDEAERELNVWIRDNTRATQAFIDSQLTLPVFARRALWVGLDLHPKGSLPVNDGWYLHPRELVVDFLGANPGLFDYRADLARSLLAAPAERIDEALLRLARAAPEDGLGIVARDPQLSSELSRSARIKSVFANRAAAVFWLPRDSASIGPRG